MYCIIRTDTLTSSRWTLKSWCARLTSAPLLSTDCSHNHMCCISRDHKFYVLTFLLEKLMRTCLEQHPHRRQCFDLVQEQCQISRRRTRFECACKHGKALEAQHRSNHIMLETKQELSIAEAISIDRQITSHRLDVLKCAIKQLESNNKEVSRLFALSECAIQ